jgi:hypothetical protein
VIGQSHITALRTGFFQEPSHFSSQAGRPVEISFLFLSPSGAILYSGRANAEPSRFANHWQWEPERFREEVAQLIGETDHVAVLWYGAQVSTHFTLAVGPEFDVMLSDGSAVEGQIIPRVAIEELLRSTVEDDPAFRTIAGVLAASAVAGKPSFLGPPPPLPIATVRERLGTETYFAERAGELDVELATAPLIPDHVRAKVWKLLMSVYAAIAERHGGRLIPPPDEAVDETGLLAPAFWSHDITHANENYGRAYLRRILTRALGEREIVASHPYAAAPPRAFWSRSVARNFDPAAVSDPPPFRLHRCDRFMSAGSCFASNVRRYIEAVGLPYTVTERPHPLLGPAGADGFYDAYSARYGNIYTARQMAQLLERADGAFSPMEDRWIDGDTWIDPFRPGLKHRAHSDAEFDALTAQHLAAVRRAVEESSVFIFTLGLTEAWLSQADGVVFPACPGTISGTFDPGRHEFHNFTADEVADDLRRLVTRARMINPSLKVILTVSPVPLVATATGRHVLAATVYSKSVLRVAADVAARTLSNVAYFPAYELVTGPQAAYETFAADRRNVTEEAVQGVMTAFFEAFMGPDAVKSRTAADADNRPGSDAEPAALGLRDALTDLVAAQCDEEMADPGLRETCALP